MKVDSGFWKMVAGMLLSALLTGAASFLLLGAKKVDAAEVRQMIQTESPYVKDKRLVEQALEEIKLLRTDVATIKATVATLEERTRK